MRPRSPRGSTGSGERPNRPRSSAATPTRPKGCRASRRTCATRSRGSSRAPSPARLSAKNSSSTTCTSSARNSGSSTRRSPIGSGRVFSREVDDAAQRQGGCDHGRRKRHRAGGRAHFVHADVSRGDDVREMVEEAEKTYGRVNVLFNNAGVFPDADGSVLDTDEETWDFVLRVNLKGIFLGCKYGIPALLRAGGGSIVNTASFVALMGAATPQIAYTASKGGVLSMTRETAIEFARRGIRVNALCPGPVDTPLMAELLGDPARRARRMVHIPFGRLARA